MLIAFLSRCCALTRRLLVELVVGEKDGHAKRRRRRPALAPRPSRRPKATPSFGAATAAPKKRGQASAAAAQKPPVPPPKGKKPRCRRRACQKAKAPAAQGKPPPRRPRPSHQKEGDKTVPAQDPVWKSNSVSGALHDVSVMGGRPGSVDGEEPASPRHRAGVALMKDDVRASVP